MRLLKKHPKNRVFSQPTFEIEEDLDYRYFDNMWHFMESGVNAEIIEIEGEEEFDENFRYHGRVLVLIRSLMIKGKSQQANNLTEIIDTLTEKMNVTKKEISEEKIKKVREYKAKKADAELKARIRKFRRMCYLKPEFSMKVSFVRFWLSIILIKSEGKVLTYMAKLAVCSALALAFESS